MKIAYVLCAMIQAPCSCTTTLFIVSKCCGSTEYREVSVSVSRNDLVVLLDLALDYFV